MSPRQSGLVRSCILPTRTTFQDFMGFYHMMKQCRKTCREHCCESDLGCIRMCYVYLPFCLFLATLSVECSWYMDRCFLHAREITSMFSISKLPSFRHVKHHSNTWTFSPHMTKERFFSLWKIVFILEYKKPGWKIIPTSHPFQKRRNGLYNVFLFQPRKLMLDGGEAFQQWSPVQ